MAVYPETLRGLHLHNLLCETANFIDNVYVPDVEFLAKAYTDTTRSDMDWCKLGGNKNFLTFGEFPMGDVEPDDFFFPRGAIVEGGLVEDVDLGQIYEHVRHSWYSSNTARHPSAGETIPNYTGLNTPDR